jgi:hypothetical protein
MYNRRLIRLIEKLNSNDNKLMIRMMHSLDSHHPEINGNIEKDNIDNWVKFYDDMSLKYKNIKLLLISKESDIFCIKNIKKGLLYINDKKIFDNLDDALFLFLKDINYEEL